MSIAYTYVIIDNTTGTDCYVGSSRKQNRLYFHERPENTTSSKQIIDNGDYLFEMINTFNGKITDEQLRKKEQALMNKMRKVYDMNVVNPQNAYTSEYHKKQVRQRQRNDATNKLDKRNYDIQRNHWRYSWEETCRDIGSFNNISWDCFQ